MEAFEGDHVRTWLAKVLEESPTGNVLVFGLILRMSCWVGKKWT